MKGFGNILRELRNATGKSLRDVQALTGLHAVVLGSYEREDRAPSIYKASEILAYYGKALAVVDADGGYTNARKLPMTDEDIANTLEDIAYQIRTGK